MPFPLECIFILEFFRTIFEIYDISYKDVEILVFVQSKMFFHCHIAVFIIIICHGYYNDFLSYDYDYFCYHHYYM